MKTKGQHYVTPRTFLFQGMSSFLAHNSNLHHTPPNYSIRLFGRFYRMEQSSAIRLHSPNFHQLASSFSTKTATSSLVPYSRNASLVSPSNITTRFLSPDYKSNLVLDLIQKSPSLFQVVRKQTPKGVLLQDISHLHVYNSGKLSEAWSFSFAGVMHDKQLFFQLGVAIAIQKFLNPEILGQCVFLGSSYASLIAAALAGSSLQELKDHFQKTIAIGKKIEVESLHFGLRNDKLMVSTTNSMTLENELISVSSKSEFIDALKKGSGSFSDNQPLLNNLTVTISSSPGTANICPKEHQLDASPDQLFKSGFQEAKGWILKLSADVRVSRKLFSF
jgi:hypothetical protein